MFRNTRDKSIDCCLTGLKQSVESCQGICIFYLTTNFKQEHNYIYNVKRVIGRTTRNWYAIDWMWQYVMPFTQLQTNKPLIPNSQFYIPFNSRYTGSCSSADGPDWEVVVDVEPATRTLSCWSESSSICSWSDMLSCDIKLTLMVDKRYNHEIYIYIVLHASEFCDIKNITRY